MDNPDTAVGLERSKLIVMVERHLQSELGLLGHLDELNLALKTALEISGPRGLSTSQTAMLDPMVTALSEKSAEAKAKRKKLLLAINAGRGTNQPQLSVRQFIQTLDPVSEKRLENMRVDILDRLTEAHANLIGNQAVMFYAYDFYKKMVAGILKSDVDSNQYSMTGQSTAMKPGDLFRKAC